MPCVKIDKERCKGCELCTFACHQHVLGMSKELNTKGYFPALVERGPRCIGCRMCAVMCPDVAIEIGIHGVQYNLYEY
ncbi:MAG: tungsten formylmethanofuran dehydrogenase [Deltaproteobacteria bacterium]|nr:tungsten formylmethanofuran dehydrogenase [Deltaproteobacteria bacterium]